MSTINLVKGQNTDLTKTNPSVTNFSVGLGWDANDNNGNPFDLDVSAFVLGSDGKKLSPEHLVFYNNKTSPSNSVVHTGDNLTGNGDGDDETINVDFSKIEDEAMEIVFVVTIYDGAGRSQNFGQVKNSYIRIYKTGTDEEILKYELGEDFSIETSIEFGSLYRKDGEWKFRAIGQGKMADLQVYVDQY